MSKQDIKIYFGTEMANLYDLGYITTDLYQIFAFSDLLEQNETEKVEKYFGEKSRPFNRYLTVLDKYKKDSSIVDVKKGSIELLVANAPLLAAIIMPLVAIKVQSHFTEKGRQIQFELSPTDPSLKRIMDSYAAGEFGNGREGLEVLFSILEQREYSVSLTGPDAYSIEHVVDKYAQRIVKTIDKNMLK